jgi:hypothetical protein
MRFEYQNNIEIFISRKELEVIYKIMAFLEIGLHSEQYFDYLGVNKSYIDLFISKLSNIIDIIEKSTNKEGKIYFVLDDASKNHFSHEISKIVLRAIYGALISISIWVSESDISSIMGIDPNDFFYTKKEILIMLREIDRRYMSKSPHLTYPSI